MKPNKLVLPYLTPKKKIVKKEKKNPLCLPLIIHEAMHTAVKLITILGELSQTKLKCELLYTSLVQCYRLNIKENLLIRQLILTYITVKF